MHSDPSHFMRKLLESTDEPPESIERYFLVSSMRLNYYEDPWKLSYYVRIQA